MAHCGARKSRLLGIVLSLLLFKSGVWAEENGRVLHEPDHLVPVQPYCGDEHLRYINILHSRLGIDTKLYLVTMLVRPSFSGEYVVGLHGGAKEYDSTDAKQLFVTCARAAENVWYSLPEHNQGWKAEEVAVSTKTVEIAKPLGIRVHALWRRTLLRTRYPEADHTGVDGTIYEFYTAGLYGETWSPSEVSIPSLFIDLGDSLVAFCNATSADRNAATKQIEQKASKLERYLDDHPLR